MSDQSDQVLVCTVAEGQAEGVICQPGRASGSEGRWGAEKPSDLIFWRLKHVHTIRGGERGRCRRVGVQGRHSRSVLRDIEINKGVV